MDPLLFAFQPSPSGPEDHYALTDAQLVKQDAWSVSFAEVTGAHYAVHSTRAGPTKTLILTAAEQDHHIDWVTFNAASDAHNGFEVLMRAVGGHLDAAQPGFQIAVGMLPRSKMMMFGAFAFALAVGLGLVIAMILGNLGLDVMLGAGLPLLALVVLGGSGMWMFSPWRTPQMTAARTFMVKRA